MANLIAKQSGNFEDASSWGLGSTEGLVLTQYSSGTTLTTSYQFSSAFTVTAGQQIDGIMVRVYKYSAGATGTFTLCLSENRSTAISGTEVVVDLANLSPSTEYQWVFCKFDSTHTATGGTGYGVGLKASGTNLVVGGRQNSTAANWMHVLRLTSTQAPAAGDTLWVVGEHTNATTNGWTLSYGETVSAAYTGLVVGYSSTVQIETSASTAYVMTLAGNLLIEKGGTFQAGSVATPMPSTSSFTLTFQLASDVQYGISVYSGGTLTMQGNALSYDRCLLAADASIGATALTSSVTTGWKSGDQIAIATTDADRTHSESRILDGDASGTTINITAGLTYAHTGTSPFQAEIIHLTRNVKITTSSASYRTYIYTYAGSAQVNMDWVEFINFGSATSSKQGLVCQTTTGSIAVNNCALHDGNGNWIYVTGTATANVTIQDNVGYNLTGTNSSIYTASAIDSSCVIDGNWLMTLGGAGIYLDGYCTVSDNVIVGWSATSSAFYLNKANVTSLTWFTGNKAHSCAGNAITFSSTATIFAPTLTSFIYWNVGTGLNFLSVIDGITITGITGYGANTTHIYMVTTFNGLCEDSYFGNTSVYTSGKGITLATANTPVNMIFDNVDFRPSVTGVTAVSTLVNFTANLASRIVFRWCKMTTDVANAVSGMSGNARPSSYVRIEQWDQTPGSHAYFAAEGIIMPDTARYATSSPGQRVYGVNGGSGYMESGPKQVALANGESVTWSVKVRKSSGAAGDSGTYAGTEPQLMVRASYDGGLMSDTLLDTAAAAVDVWETLTGAVGPVTGPCVVEAYVRLDNNSNTQFVTLDDWSAVIS